MCSFWIQTPTERDIACAARICVSLELTLCLGVVLCCFSTFRIIFSGSCNLIYLHFQLYSSFTLVWLEYLLMCVSIIFYTAKQQCPATFFYRRIYNNAFDLKIKHLERK